MIHSGTEYALLHRVAMSPSTTLTARVPSASVDANTGRPRAMLTPDGFVFGPAGVGAFVDGARLGDGAATEVELP
ncbi:hypothetical protein [Catenuloplanes indicus]|uniref:Uncharacterized protein n=1 Tax=Catenuloplanes indicus TaxID=137267 RepID=A0AAE3VZ36_9ACTN|nr:hypothetical protein [Catenuloplanes indicus]MDQ0366638.1 hypothetical protein [Catenuloplanes indicus]